MAKGLSDLSAEIDALYRLSLPEFTAGRNALMARVRAEQGKDAAADIKALEKPSISAWVVNQLYWRHRRDFDHLLKSGDDLRIAQQKRLAGRDVDVNAAIDRRRDALAALMDKSTDLLEEAGSTSPEIRQRVANTLEALSVYGTSDTAPRAGRLVDDVQPPGFAALAALVPASFAPVGKARPSAGKAAPEPSEDEPSEGEPSEDEAPPAKKPAPALRVVESRRVEKARAALEEAEIALAQARDAAQQASAGQTKAQAEWEAARDALEAVQRTLDEALERERVSMIERDARRRAATQATQALGRAERARDEAERYLESLRRE